MRYAALLLVLAITSCQARQVQAPTQAPVVAIPEDQKTAIEGVVEQYRQAHEVSSLKALEALYSQDLDLVLVYQGQQHQGWTAVQTFLAARFEGADEVRMGIKEVAIRSTGPNSAIVTAKRDSSVKNGAITLTETGILTLALQKREGRWLVVAQHFSYPPSVAR